MSEDLYRRIVDAASDYAMIAFDADAVVQLWSAGAENVFGMSADEAMGTTAEVIFTPEDRVTGEYRRELAIAATEGKAEDDRWHLRRDGSRFWASGILTSVRDASGTVVGFVKVVRDKSDERRLQENLRKSEDQFARLFLGNPAATVVIRESSGVFMFANESFFRLVGYWRSEALGRTAKELRLWDQKHHEQATQGLERRDVVESVVLGVRNKSGQVRECVAALAKARLDGEECVVMTLIPRG
jgi:PAS domain S-box-containing protein